MSNFLQKGRGAIANVAASIYKATSRKADNSIEKARKVAAVAARKTKRAALNSAERVASYSTTIAVRAGKTTTEVTAALGESVREVASAKAQTAKILVSVSAETAKNAIVERGLQITSRLHGRVMSYVGTSTEIIMEKSVPLLAQAQLMFLKNIEKVAQFAPALARNISMIDQVKGQNMRNVKPNTAVVEELQKGILSDEMVNKHAEEKYKTQKIK